MKPWLWVMRKSSAKLRFIIHRIGRRKQRGGWEIKKREMEEASIRIQHEQKTWIKHEWMKVWKLNSAVLQFWSCTQALSANVCQSVRYEAPLWAALLLVYYGWGSILRQQGCCVLIFSVEGDDTWLLPNPFMRSVRCLMGSNMQVQHVFAHRPDPCLKYAHREEEGGKQTLTHFTSVSPNSISYRQCSLRSDKAHKDSLHTLHNVWFTVCSSCQCKCYQ